MTGAERISNDRLAWIAGAEPALAIAGSPGVSRRSLDR